MAFQISPGVNVSEIDLTTIVPAVSTTEGGVAGHFNWGPVNERILIDSEFTLVDAFQKPSNESASDFFTAASFLAYGNQLWVVRAQPSNGLNANSGANTTLVVLNETDYTENFSAGDVSRGTWIAKYPGKLGNSLKVSVCGDSNAWESTLSANVYATKDDLSGTQIDDRKQVYGDFYLSGFSNGTNFTTTLVRDGSGADLSTLFAVGNSSTQNAYTNGQSISLGGTTRGNFSTDYVLTITTNAVGNTIVSIALTTKGAFYETIPAGPITFTGSFTNNSVIFGEADSDFSVAVQANTVTGGTAFDSEVVAGDLLVLGTRKTMYTVASVVSNTHVTISSVYDQDTGVQTDVERRWEFYNLFDDAPGTSDFVTNRGGSNDEMHVVVADEDGDWTQVKNQVLERYPFVSKATDARTADGATNYYKNKINNVSKYIWWGSHDGALGASNSTDATTAFSISTSLPITESLSEGSDGAADGPDLAARTNAYDEFRNAEEVDVSIIVAASGNLSELDYQSLSNYIIQNICEFRKDCVATISPHRNNVIENSATPVSEQTDVIAFRDSLTSTSFAVMDSGWKYQYDRYNDVYRWVPLSGDIAGLMVRTDSVKDPWFSPAGYNRGTIKNVVKLAYNPEKSQRDQLYKNGVNPVVSFPGQGVVLFGDKTMLKKPSAFDRINVRRLFIVLEKAISTAAQFALFEFNDSFTRAQFKNLIEPFLRDVKGRRGIYDFKVVCDETNNTPEIIDSNQFVGDIYIKPARSINFIQLNFVAVRTGVEFEEIVGRF